MDKLLLDAFKSLNDVTDIEIPSNYKFKIKKQEPKKLTESLNEGYEFYVVSDGKNPRNSIVFTKDGREHALELAKAKTGGYWEVIHNLPDNSQEVIWSTKEADESLTEAPNPNARVTILNDDEKIIKEVGHSALIKKGDSHYIIKYAPGYYVSGFDADTDEEAIKHFMGESLKEDLNSLKLFKVTMTGTNLKTNKDADKSVAYQIYAKDKQDAENKVKDLDSVRKIIKVEEIDDSLVENINEASEEVDNITSRRAGKIKRSRNIKTESLLKEEKIDLNDTEEVEKGLDILHKEEEPVEKIVDVDATTVDELKDSYIGNVILQCPVCRTLIYKKPDAIKKEEKEDDDEDETEDKEETDVIIFNKGEECPHCGSVDGYEAVGQVAPLDIEVEKPIQTTGKETQDEVDTETVEVEKPKDKSKLKELDIDTDVEMESFDEEKFDKVINEFLTKTYRNIDNYKTNDASVNESFTKLVLEGTLTYKSGKTESVTFNFDRDRVLKEDNNKKVIFTGTNTKFKEGTSFVLNCSLNNKDVVIENLDYKINIKEKLIEGKVNA